MSTTRSERTDTPPTEITPLESDTVARVTKRLLPLIMLLFLVAYLDRTNISVAALTMNADIGLTATAYGVGAGLFYVTYILAEVPSNLALDRFGARVWIARIMITWGIVAGCMALVQGDKSFILVRMLLGAAEAGFTPGIIFYLSLWFPSRHRARATARFYVGSALATCLGAPISGLIVRMDGLWPGSRAGSGCSSSRRSPPCCSPSSCCATSPTPRRTPPGCPRRTRPG